MILPFQQATHDLKNRDGASHTDGSSYANKFSGKYAHRIIQGLQIIRLDSDYRQVLTLDCFRFPAKRNCVFFDSALSYLAGRFLMFEEMEAAPQQSDTTGPAQPDSRRGSRRAGSVYGTSSNCGSAGRVYESGFRDYTVA